MSETGALAPAKLRCEYLTDPLGIDAPRPRLSWIVESVARGQKQTAYRILVASEREILAGGRGDLWDSGKVPDDRTAHVEHGGKRLKSRMRCHWKVRVWDRDGRASDWSAPALWTMGLLEEADWQASWIGFDKPWEELPRPSHQDLDRVQWIWHPEGDPAKAAPQEKRWFRRAVTLPADREVALATCSITADGEYELFVNGQRVARGANVNLVVERDVTQKLRPGKNVVAVAAANTGDEPNPAGLLVALRVEFKSGPALVVTTDDAWSAAKVELPNWSAVDFDDSHWEKALVLKRRGLGLWTQLDTRQTFLPPPRYLRKEFALRRPVRRATVYATALGIYDLHLNGRRVSADYFNPGWTDYDTRVYYQTFDVTALVREGDNALGALLADGWYAGYIGYGRRREHYGGKLRLRARLELEYADGARETVVTDGSWKAATGAWREADFLMGEVYDARAEPRGWDAPGFDAAAWSGVNVTNKIAAKIQARPHEPVRACAEHKPLSVAEPKPGRFVFDLGTNFAGVARLKVTGAPRGKKIVLRFAERLNPDGTIYTTNLRGARATDTYYCRGGGAESWTPRFTFHGFQYVEVSGYPGRPGADAITGVELTSATPDAGGFRCSNQIANQLYRNIRQTQRANFIDIPTDCPQRDERLGWTGDAQAYIRTATYNSDVAAFFSKWLTDLADAERADGAFPDVAPHKVAVGAGVAAWADAGVICPWVGYRVYGDERLLARHYPGMTRWLAWCEKDSENLLRPAYGFGDWLSIGADSPKDVLGTAYFAHSADLTARAAEVLDKRRDAKKYRALFERIADAFNKAYVGEDGEIKGDTQTVYVLALAFDLLPVDQRPRALRRLVDDIESRGGHLSTGFVGTRDVMHVLTRFGRNDVAYRLFHNTTFPSWGFSVVNGATSIWERWDGWTPERGFQDPGMNSFSHYAYGAVGEWMFKNIAGIDLAAPGYERIVIRPRPGGKVTSCTAHYDSMRGRIATEWKLTGDAFTLNVAIPANAAATVFIPARRASDVKEGGRAAARLKDVKFLRMENGEAVFEVGSGTYAFSSSGEQR